MGISKAKMDELRNDFGGICKKCGSKKELQFAHILPTNLYGKNSRGSQARYDDILKHPLAYVLLCRKCHDKICPSVYAMREMKKTRKGQEWHQLRRETIPEIAQKNTARVMVVAGTSLGKPAVFDKNDICVILKPESQTIRIVGSGAII